VSEEQTSEGEPKQAGSEKEACPLESEVERGRSEGKIERVDRKNTHARLEGQADDDVVVVVKFG
jgi:hypothetical protein